MAKKKGLQEFMQKLGLGSDAPEKALPVVTPIDGAVMGEVTINSVEDVADIVTKAQEAFQQWRLVPMPVRGRLIGIFGDLLRQHKTELGEMVTLECGKIRSEGLGEVQEMIDVCEYAVGLSRQIGGQIMPSELAGHYLQERWHPKGVVGVISAFNFPVAVWAWNFAISIVCGNANIWKPSEKTPIVALSCQYLFEQAIDNFTKETGVEVPAYLSNILHGGADIGEALIKDARVALVSATGSCAMGTKVQQEVAQHLGRQCLLELGGNNAVIITPSAPLLLAIESTLFGAIGTAGQRCTTSRRLFVHESFYDDVFSVLEKAYHSIDTKVIGDPLESETLIGPLIDRSAYDAMQDALSAARAQGADIIGGERILVNEFGDKAYYVRPALVKVPEQSGIVLQETFAPILYVMPYTDLNDVIELNNTVPQGLSSAIFTTDLREAEQFLRDSDCGIANVNNGTSGAEIGGAFGGNKETGGGRESGSDSWKQYMNRSTNRINFAPDKLSLAQGVEFPIEIDSETVDNLQRAEAFHFSQGKTSH